MIGPERLRYVYLIHWRNTTYSPVYTTKEEAKRNKRRIFTNEKDYKEAWIEELVIALPDKVKEKEKQCVY